jgi:hypothetical protein
MHRVQHTSSTTYTEYSIHRVQHTPSTASTQDRLSSFYSNEYKLTAQCSFSLQHASWHDRPPSASSPWELKDIVTFSHSHVCKSTNGGTQCQRPACRASTGSKYSSKLTRLQPLSSHDHGLQVCFLTCSITSSKCIFKLTKLRPPSVSPNSLIYSIQVRTIMASKYISNLAPLWPPNTSPNSLNHGPQVYFQTRSITASKCISELHDLGLQVHLQTRSILASKCISKLTRSQPWSISPSSADRHVQAYLNFLPSTVCSQSWFTFCRWVAI